MNASGMPTAFIGSHTEWDVASSSLTRYYYAGSTRVAMRKNNTVYYLLSDHLGSTSLTTDENGQNPVKQYYLPWGEVRYTDGTLQTKYTYTGQYSNLTDFGLMYYNARWYDSLLGRFTSADTIVPQPGNPSSFDRYSYVNNNPIRNIDPSGHRACSGWDENGNCIPDDDWSLRGRRNVRSLIGNGSNQFSNQDFTGEPNIPEPTSSIFGYQIDENQCATSPCFRPWETPWWWDTDPKKPDYYILSVNYGEGAGITFNIIIDRFGNVYIGAGGNIGKSISPVTISINGGWIGSVIDNNFPDQGNIDAFFKGLSFNGQIGVVGDVAATWSPFTGDYVNPISVEYGGVLPFSLGVSAAFTFKLIDGYKLFGRQ